VRAFVAEPMRVPTESMLPTLRAGDHVLVGKVGEVARGDLVVFDPPPNQGADLLLKRVVAVGGDEVGIEDGELVVNGRTVVEAYAPPARLDGVYFGPVRIAHGQVFVLGDNRRDSVDSRTFGTVPERTIHGRVLIRLWPDPRGRP
jgi:signal peptidase I